MGRAGLEHSANPAGNTRVSDSGGSKSGNNELASSDQRGAADCRLTVRGEATCSQVAPTADSNIEADLRELAAAWSAIPPAIRIGVMALVRTVKAANER